MGSRSSHNRSTKLEKKVKSEFLSHKSTSNDRNNKSSLLPVVGEKINKSVGYKKSIGFQKASNWIRFKGMLRNNSSLKTSHRNYSKKSGSRNSSNAY